MTSGRTATALAVTTAAVLLATAGWPTLAQGPGQDARKESTVIKEAPRVAADPVRVEATSDKPAVAVALTRPARLPFREGTTLEGLADHLRAGRSAAARASPGRRGRRA